MLRRTRCDASSIAVVATRCFRGQGGVYSPRPLGKGPLVSLRLPASVLSDLYDCWGEHIAEWGHLIGTEGVRGWGRHPRPRMLLSRRDGDWGLEFSVDDGLSALVPDRDFVGFSRPEKNRFFPIFAPGRKPEISPPGPRPGGSRGAPPGPPFSGVFIRFGRVAWKSICFCVRREGGRFGKIDPRIQWITTFCSFLFVKRRKIAKNRKKTGFPFVPTGRVIKYPKKCTPAGHFSGIFRPHEIPDALGVPFPGYPQAFRPRSEGSRRHDPDSASDIITHLAGHDVFRLGQRRSATSSDVL